MRGKIMHGGVGADLMGFSLGELRERTRKARDHQERLAREYIKQNILPVIAGAADHGSSTVYYALHDVYTKYQGTFIHNGLLNLGFKVVRDDLSGIDRLLISW